MSKKFRWGAIQPLTGGMYFGAEEAIGHPAEWIISYPGNNDPKYNREGVLVDSGNEYNLTQYLEKHGRMPAYYEFGRKMFQDDMDLNPMISCTNMDKPWDPGEMDLVVAVPVCSGLSSATIGSKDTKDARNCNMLWITRFALHMIKPRAYVFENAPRLMGTPGEEVREELEKIAYSAGYSVVYYKTDTNKHENCQRRERTFILFFRGKDIPVLGYENKPMTIEEFFSKIPKGLTQEVPVDTWVGSRLVWEFVSKKLGPDWRKESRINMVEEIPRRGWMDEFRKFVQDREDVTDHDKAVILKFIDRVERKLAAGLGYYSDTAITPKGHMPAIMFKTIKCIMHHEEDRLVTIRECLELMGMPHDFEMQGDLNKVFPKIGQNVPVRTAKWIVSEVVRVLEDDSAEWEQEPQPGCSAYFNNIKEKRVW